MKKQVDFVVSNTYLSSFYACVDRIKQISDNDKFQNVILVVPDKFSMNAEQLLFERLKTNSLFNVWLTTLTRLEKKVLQNAEAGLNVLTKQSGTMLVSKIILQNADKLTTYKKIQNKFSFAENMFNTINLLKSSGIKPRELIANIDNTNFGSKVKDIHLIYSEYEKSLGSDNLDTVTRFELFDKVAKNDEYIKNSHIFFAMFDSFTNAQISLLANLSQYVKSLTIGCCYNVLQGNKHIYDNVVFQRLNNAFLSNNIKPNVKFVNTKFDKLQNFMLNNLFDFDNNLTFETDKVKIVECENVSQELRYVASKIKYLVLEKGYSFDDINIAVNGLDNYILQAKNIFAEYDLPVFIDENKTLNQHYFIKTLLNIFDFLTDKNLTVDAISITQSPLFNIDSEKLATFENFCYKYNIVADEFFKPFVFENSNECVVAEEVRQLVFVDILNLKSSLQNSQNFAEITDNLISYLEHIKAKENIDNYSQQQDIVEKSIDAQVYDKFIDLINQSKSMLGLEEVSLEFAFDILKSGFNSVKLSTVPIKCDSVFVGDSSSSTFIPKKALFVVGATQSYMPSSSIDAGTITDDEIENFKAKQQITPSIRELNKREKFKLFNLVLNFTDRLELTYSLLLNGEVQFASEFVTKISQILTCNGKNISAISYNQIPLLVFENQNNEMLPEYFVGTEQNAVRLAKSKKQENSALKFMLCQNLSQTLLQQEKLYFADLKRFVIQNAKEVMFPNGLTKVSQVEKYFNCPFKQFVDYGLRPQKHQKFEIRALDVGNILHTVAQLFVNKCIKLNFENIVTDKIAVQCFDKVINSDAYKNLKDKKYEIKNLRQEAVRFCSAIKYQIDNTDYKPKQTEYKFENYKLPSGLTLKGFVDRLDICDQNNSFRVIDYKTGQDKFSFQTTYYGLKIQLIVYLKVLQDILNKKPVSAMYMPVKNSFSNEQTTEFESYKLDGIILNDKGVLYRTDKQLIDNLSSDIINVTFKKDGEVQSHCANNMLSGVEFEDLMEYCCKILNGAVDEMLNGYIQPKPFVNDLKNSCEYCEYKAMCHYDILQNGYRAIDQKKDKYSFKEKDDR